MSRYSRINTIWRKELIDTLRDRRTLIAMIFVPMVLYPVMMLGSLQGFELQFSRLTQEQHTVVVESEEVRAWLRWVLDTDAARRPGTEGLPAERIYELSEQGELSDGEEALPPGGQPSSEEAARARVREQPPDYLIEVIPDRQQLLERVITGNAQAALLVESELPKRESLGTAVITLVLDQTDVRSAEIAIPGLEGVLHRLNGFLLAQRLRVKGLDNAFVSPVEVSEQAIASPEKIGGSILGRIVPLILVIMTITGAIYPAIDLTAGERERGTLETLMVAPVPTVDLIAGKFVVVALIAMFSAALNLLSIGGTIYLGGLGDLLTRGSDVVIPLSALPWVLLVLIPLAIMFSAALLAVCSFARSFKEAQNYVMPVMVAAMIPSVVGILPGMRLEGPLLIMPVTNIVILSRDLFMGRFDVYSILWVTLSTTLYAGAAVAVAAKLFGQEAVLFADSGSIKTIFKRRFFKPALRPTTSHAFLLLAVIFSVNFFAQQSLLNKPGVIGTTTYWIGFAAILVTLFVLVPVAAAAYMRVRIPSAFSLSRPTALGLTAALCFGLSTWILAQAWLAFQKTWLPLPPEMAQAYSEIVAMFEGVSPWTIVLVMAVVPAICEELFFRGYALSGLRGGIGWLPAVLVVAVAFGIYHGSVYRLIMTTVLGVLFGLLVIRHRAIWPAMLAHLMHNTLLVLSAGEDGLKPFLEQWGFHAAGSETPAWPWIIGAAALLALGLLLCLARSGGSGGVDRPAEIRHNEDTGIAGGP